MKITEYTSKGEKLYRWSGYVGTDAVGQLITKRSGFISKREAELSYYKFVDEFNQGMHHRKDPNAMKTLNDLYRLWFKSYKDTVSPATINKTTQMINQHYLKPYGDLSLDEFTPVKVYEIALDMKSKLLHYKKSLNYLVKMFRLAVTLNIIDASPFDRVELPKERPATKKDKALDRDQFATFWRLVVDTFGQTNYKAFTFMRLLAFTGMRRGEALALSWSDIDFNAGTVHIHKSLTLGLNNVPYISPTAKTDAGNRVIRLDNETLAIMSELYKRDSSPNDEGSELIFVDTKKGALPSLNTPQKWMNKIVNSSKGSLPHITPHMLRHTFITLTLESGHATIKQVQYMVGHNDVAVTMNTYNHITAKQAESAGDAFAKSVSGLIE
jgi:integrase